MTFDFKILLGIGILFSSCTKVPKSSYLSSDIDLEHHTNLYVTNVPKIFDTLTVFVTKDKIKDYRAVSYFKKIAKFTGDTNIATNVSYGYGNRRYRETMKYLKSCTEINPNNLPLVLFYIKDDDSCYTFNYSNYEEFQSIMDLTAHQLEKASIEPTEIRKFQTKQVIHDKNKKSNLSKTLMDTLDIFIDKIFEIWNK